MPEEPEPGPDPVRSPDPPPDEHGTDPVTTEHHAARQRRSSRLAGALIGALVLLLGFAIAVQVRSSAGDSLATARSDDLVRILDDQNSRAVRLREQLAELQSTESQLKASGGQDSVALAQAQAQLAALRVLLGVVPATGPGVTLQITDPDRKLSAEDLLDVVQELRGAGAEAVQFDTVRVGTNSSFADATDGVHLDGHALGRPYSVLAIGDPPTLDRALNIVGGVASTVRLVGGTATISQQAGVTIAATRSLPESSLAKPAK